MYTPTREEARRARPIVEAELNELGLRAHEIRIEHWLHDEDRWDDEPPGPDIEDELLEHGFRSEERRVGKECRL